MVTEIRFSSAFSGICAASLLWLTFGSGCGDDSSGSNSQNNNDNCNLNCNDNCNSNCNDNCNLNCNDNCTPIPTCADGDEDGDGYGVGPTCPTVDCNDDATSIYPGAPEQCNGVDDDCDGVLDGAEGLTRPCGGSEEGICTLGVETCDDTGAWVGCSAVAPDATDLPSLDFLDRNCDGLDGDLSDAVFVSVDDGDATSVDCSQASPCTSITRGLEEAIQTGKSQILVQAGYYNEVLILDVTHVDIGIYGGYGPGWERGPSSSATYLTIIEGTYGPAPGLGDIAATAVAQGAQVTFQNLTLQGPSLPSFVYESSYVVHASQQSDLRFQAVTFVQGDGAAGREGAAGERGYVGDTGHDGQRCEAEWGAPSHPPRLGGDGGANMTYGGTGGAGGTATPTAPAAGDPGYQGGADGGAAGTQANPGLGTWTCTDGERGTDGASGADGIPGAGGSTGFDGLRMTRGDGAAGTNGQNGASGGGGGGAGVHAEPFIGTWLGGGGGGGGGGGQRALAGEAGLGGGSSLGILAVGSTLRLEACTFLLGKGGDGGKGGRYGPRSFWAVGGRGGEACDDSWSNPQGCSGGGGGWGGQGGAGGAGGGGGGGHVYGVYLHGSSLTQVSSQFVGGAYGLGGQGGDGKPYSGFMQGYRGVDGVLMPVGP